MNGDSISQTLITFFFKSFQKRALNQSVQHLICTPLTTTIFIKNILVKILETSLLQVIVHCRTGRLLVSIPRPLHLLLQDVTHHRMSIFLSLFLITFQLLFKLMKERGKAVKAIFIYSLLIMYKGVSWKPPQ